MTEEEEFEVLYFEEIELFIETDSCGYKCQQEFEYRIYNSQNPGPEELPITTITSESRMRDRELFIRCDGKMNLKEGKVLQLKKITND